MLRTSTPPASPPPLDLVQMSAADWRAQDIAWARWYAETRAHIPAAIRAAIDRGELAALREAAGRLARGPAPDPTPAPYPLPSSAEVSMPPRPAAHIRLHHATFTRFLPAILTQGLLLHQPANGRPRGSRTLHACTEWTDAACWAFRMGWDLTDGHRTDRLTAIVTLEDISRRWRPDRHREHITATGQWLQSRHTVPPTQILQLTILTPDLIRETIRTLTPQGAPPPSSRTP